MVKNTNSRKNIIFPISQYRKSKETGNGQIEINIKSFNKLINRRKRVNMQADSGL